MFFNFTKKLLFIPKLLKQKILFSSLFSFLNYWKNSLQSLRIKKNNFLKFKNEKQTYNKFKNQNNILHEIFIAFVNLYLMVCFYKPKNRLEVSIIIRSTISLWSTISFLHSIRSTRYVHHSIGLTRSLFTSNRVY